MNTPASKEAKFYRDLLEQICQDKRNTRGKRLASSGLQFWDAMQKPDEGKWKIINGTNFAWIVIFLRNGGEKLKAIWLTKNVLGVSLGEAKNWVESVKLNRHRVSMAAKRKLHAEYPAGLKEELEDYTEYTVSHWPKSLSTTVNPPEPRS